MAHQTNFKHEAKTRAQMKAARARLQAKIEREENAKVVARCDGMCEVVLTAMCPAAGTQIHHMLGGWKLRGKGRSALAEHKQLVCDWHHRAITGDVNNKLVRVGGPVPHWTDHYRRAV